MGQKPQPLSESPAVIKSCDVSVKTPSSDGEREGRMVERGEERRGEERRGEERRGASGG